MDEEKQHFILWKCYSYIITYTLLYIVGFEMYFENWRHLHVWKLKFGSDLSVVRLDSGLLEISAETQDIHVVFLFLCQHQGEDMKEVLSNIMIFLQEQHKACQTTLFYFIFFQNIEIFFQLNIEIFYFMCCWFCYYWTETNRTQGRCHRL